MGRDSGFFIVTFKVTLLITQIDMTPKFTSEIERNFFLRSELTEQTGRIPYIIVDNFPRLGLMAALRFLEWVRENPEGVISLPTGRTPEYFIKWAQHLLKTWSKSATWKLLDENGLDPKRKPIMEGITFVQMDDFYPINPTQHNSFNHFVREYYIKGLGLNPDKALLINSDQIPLIPGMSYQDVFPDLSIDLSLRHREARSKREELQQKSIFRIDNWCMQYEEQIRAKGGIGFFLGGIGPDGHIAFNIRGSDHHSTTRLGPTNYETQAAAASDLGGINISANRQVITIGLGTITYNPNITAIIFASGETKAPMVKAAIESEPHAQYPATVLQKLPNARFYLTEGAASQLTDQLNRFYESGPWNMDKSVRALLDYCKKTNRYAHKIDLEDLKKDARCSMIPNLNDRVVSSIIREVKMRMNRGLQIPDGKTILHTGPHHDDIMLGLMPAINRQLRIPSNDVHFAIMTSGFTAISNSFIIESLKHTNYLIDQGEIQMLEYPDFFSKGYLYKWDKDVSHYLNKVAERDDEGKKRGLSHRIVRCMVKLYSIKSKGILQERISKAINILEKSYDGEKNPPDIQTLKGMMREFEEELLWAHSGIQIDRIHHLRLGFYQGETFTEVPNVERDVEPIVELLKKVNPDVLSVTMDPEGSGPDTHYKVLQAIAKALTIWSLEKNLVNLRIHAYRNVWYRFRADEANVYSPVSLNSLALLQNSFRQCYLSQVDAAFPSPELNGPFCDLAQRIWVEQFKEVQLMLGKDFFYQNNHPLIRASHGLIFFRDLNVQEFLAMARDLEKAVGPID